MQYVGQTGRSLKTRFREHFRKMKKPKKIDTFLYRHFKNNGHPPSKIVIQPVEKNIYDPNSSTRLKNIKRHETELKWIKFLQSPFPLGFNDNIYHEGNIFFFFWGAQWLSGRVLDSRPKGSGFEPHRRHCVVVLEQDTFILA